MKITTLLKKFVDSNLICAIFACALVVAMGFALHKRGGRDLKVDLYGAAQTLQHKSPYDNPADPPRAIFRYAPAFALMMRPFLLGDRREPVAFLIEDMRLHLPQNLVFYLAKIFMVVMTIVLLVRLSDTPQILAQWRNLKGAWYLALPFFAYELSNQQNKLIALGFLVLALFLFERNRPWLAAFFFNCAVVIYLPLAACILYFLKYRRSFMVPCLCMGVVAFVAIPSLAWGFTYNNYLLQQWYERALKPFFFTNSYASYIDLRMSSQSIPSAIGRIFAYGKAGVFSYAISPVAIHVIIRIFSYTVTGLTIVAVWRSSAAFKGVQIAALLMLSLLLPSYCIYYTWAYLLPIFFFVFNYCDGPGVLAAQRRWLRGLCFAVFLVTLCIGIPGFKQYSILFWSTLMLWAGMITGMFLSPPVPER